MSEEDGRSPTNQTTRRGEDRDSTPPCVAGPHPVLPPAGRPPVAIADQSEVGGTRGGKGTSVRVCDGQPRQLLPYDR